MKRKFLSSETFDLQVPDWVYHSFVSAIVKIKVGAFPPYDQDYIDWIDNNPINLDMLFYKDGDENKATGRLLYPDGNITQIVTREPLSDEEMGYIDDFQIGFIIVKKVTIYSTDGTGKSIWNQLIEHPEISIKIKKNRSL